MWIIVIGFLIGLIVGLVLKTDIPPSLTRYTAVGILAALDAVIGAVRAELNKTYNNKIFLSGFFSNAILAMGLTLLGDRLDVNIYLAAIVAFGTRIFNNVAVIRRHFLS